MLWCYFGISEHWHVQAEESLAKLEDVAQWCVGLSDDPLAGPSLQLPALAGTSQSHNLEPT